MDQAPVYVRIYDSETVKRIIDDIKLLIDETKSTLDSIRSLSEQEHQKSEEWKSNFQAVSAKLDEAKGILSRPEGM